MRRLVLCLSVLVVFGVSAGVVLAHTAEQRAALKGDNVAPGPGDPDGSGRARIKSASEAETVCYKVIFKGIRRATGAHIHQGSRGVPGETYLRLFTSSRGKRSPVEGCKHGVPEETIEAMHDSPRAYYVDVHTKAYPEGALRGQLRNTE